MFKNEVIEEKTWEEFKTSKMLWFVNRLLHVFGWAIVIQTLDNSSTIGFPARVKFRGFDEAVDEEGYLGITKYMKENSDDLLKEIQ